MTTQELINYYADLLVLQYKGKPNAYAFTQLLVSMAVMDQLPLAVQDGYNLDTAIGVQLDVLGKYAGISRVTLTFTGQVVLDDTEYRLLIKMKVVINNSNSALSDLQNIMNFFFPTAVRVFDFQNMYMSYWIDSTQITLQLAQVFIRNGLLPKPMAVGLGSIVYAPLSTTFFGFYIGGNQVLNNVGFNSVASYDTTKKWMNASNLLSM